LIAALSPPPAVEAAEKGAQHRETFQYYDYRVDIQVPPGWKVAPRKVHYDDIELSPATRSGGVITIAFYQPLNDPGFQDFEVWTRGHLKRSQGFRRVHHRTINGNPAVTATREWFGRKLVETDIGFKDAEKTGDVFVVFLDFFDETTSPSTLVDYEAIVRSVRIAPSAPPAAPVLPPLPMKLTKPGHSSATRHPAHSPLNTTL